MTALQQGKQEVLQETFVAIRSHLSVYDPFCNGFLTWGLAIARGMALEATKRGKCSSLAHEQRTANFAGANATAKESLQKQGNSAGQLCHLEPLERAILELVYLKGLSCSEAAGALGITEERVVASLKSAFIHLKAVKSA